MAQPFRHRLPLSVTIRPFYLITYTPTWYEPCEGWRMSLHLNMLHGGDFYACDDVVELITHVVMSFAFQIGDVTAASRYGSPRGRLLCCKYGISHRKWGWHQGLNFKENIWKALQLQQMGGFKDQAFPSWMTCWILFWMRPGLKFWYVVISQNEFYILLLLKCFFLNIFYLSWKMLRM